MLRIGRPGLLALVRSYGARVRMAKETLQAQPEADAGNQQRGKAAHISPNLPTVSEGGAMPSDAVFWHVWIVGCVQNCRQEPVRKERIW